MVVSLVGFESRAAKVRREAYEHVRAWLAELPEGALMPWERTRMLRALLGVTEPDPRECEWAGGFVMLSKRQVGAIWEAIWKLPGQYRSRVRRVFDIVLLNLEPNTGFVPLFVEDFAKRLKCSKPHASAALNILVRMGVLRRERQRVPGVSGPGVAVYFVNPHAAWEGSLEVRKVEERKRVPPLLKVMQGGQSETGAP